MKKKLLTICMAGSSFLAFSQTAFEPGNLAVVRMGDGTGENGTKAQPVFIDEYSVIGDSVRTIALPTVTAGGNHRIVFSNLSSSEQEGNPTLSPDGKFLTIIGYDAALGAEDVKTTAHNFVPAIINSAGVVTTSSSLTIADFSGKVIRGAITSDGSNTWMYAATGGIHHTTMGSGTVTKVSTQPGNARYAHIFNNNLYFGTTASSTYRFRVMSPGLPTATGASATELDNGFFLDKLTNHNAFLFFDTDGDTETNPDLLYISSDAGGIQKFVLNSSGSWVLKGSLTISGYTNNQLRGLTGNYVVGQGAVLYGTTASNLLKITDISGISEDISATITSLATAPENTYFKGVVIAPGSKVGVLPVKLTSFSSKKTGNHIQLSWATASEKNNSHFEILRSGNGKEFNNIGRVKGAEDSNSEVKYSYIDFNPLNSVNYYKLKQVDFNGDSEESPVISETFQLKNTTFSVTVKENMLELSAYSEKMAEAEISVTDISGKKIKTLKTLLTAGGNILEIPVNNFSPGVYVLVLSSNGHTKSLKFVK